MVQMRSIAFALALTATQALGQSNNGPLWQDVGVPLFLNATDVLAHQDCAYSQSEQSVFIMGGLPSVLVPPATTAMLKYDIASNTITKLKDAPSGIFRSASAVLGDKLYVYQGTSEQADKTPEYQLMSYKSAEDAWETVEIKGNKAQGPVAEAVHKGVMDMFVHPFEENTLLLSSCSGLHSFNTQSQEWKRVFPVAENEEDNNKPLVDLTHPCPLTGNHFLLPGDNTYDILTVGGIPPKPKLSESEVKTVQEQLKKRRVLQEEEVVDVPEDLAQDLKLTEGETIPEDEINPDLSGEVEGEGLESSVGEVNRFRLANMAWDAKPIAFPQAVVGSANAFIDPMVYVFGGNNDRDEVVDTMYKLNLAKEGEPQWEEVFVSTVPTKRYGACTVSTSDKFFMVGGLQSVPDEGAEKIPDISNSGKMVTPEVRLGANEIWAFIPAEEDIALD